MKQRLVVEVESDREFGPVAIEEVLSDEFYGLGDVQVQVALAASEPDQ